jgi:hypothetical protein
MAITYMVHYKDDSGIEGRTTVKSESPMNNNEIAGALEEQLRANSISARIVSLDAKRIAGIAQNFQG